MATVTAVAVPKSVDGRKKALKDAADKEYQSLAGGLQLPEGDHKFITAEKNTFGLLMVDGANGKWALPIVAGEVTEAGTGAKHTFVITNNKGDKNLVIQDMYFLAMQGSTEYTIRIGRNAKGQKVVTEVGTPTENTVETKEAVEAEY